MNRIYQGRVSCVEIANPETGSPQSEPWAPAPGGDELLWRHHALFQDAINYYLVALLALAAPSNRALGQLRQRIAIEGDEFQIWMRFRRRGSARRGLRDSVAPYLAPENAAPSLEEVFRAVLAGNEADAGTRDAAVSSLLEACDGPGAIQQQGRGFWPKFCDPNTNANFAGDPAMLRRSRHQQLLPRVLNDPATTFDSPALDEFDTFSIATPDNKRPTLTPSKARDRLRQAIAVWRELRPEYESDFGRLASLIDQLPAEFVLPAYVGSSAKGDVQLRLFALLLFKHVERSPFTFELLRSATPPPRVVDETLQAVEEPVSSADPIRVARGTRGYVFRAFTSLPCWNPADRPEPQWSEFDIAAFKYALTALNQIEEKKKERDKDAAVIAKRLTFMRKGEPGKFVRTDDEEEAPPILTGDPRIERLRAVLTSERLRISNDLTDGESSDYGLHPRTIRGFRDLRKLWRRRVAAGESYSEDAAGRLRDDLREFQTANRETIGSVALFETLLERDNWIVWQEPTPELAAAWAAAGFVTDPNDPLTALLEERELAERIDRLAEPVRLTPADPIHSRRQYDFKAVTGFKAKGAYRHESAALAFTTEIAVCSDDLWRIQRIRICYSAPRFLRDALRGDEGGNGVAAARWLQPMMEALSPAPELLQNLSESPVCLMPDITASGERRVLLNFPVTLDPAALVHQLGRATDWAGQFCGTKDEPFALRWPADKWPIHKEPDAWYHRGKPLSVLGVDLGTRDAGALAHLTITPDIPAKPVHRFIGEAGSHRWFAAVTGTQLVRLPGEDAKVFRAGNPQPVIEACGERGRLASAAETAEATALIAALGQDAKQLLGDTTDPSCRFFPLQNDALLVALRRAQARLARLHSLSWRLRDEKQRTEALAEFSAEQAESPTSDSTAAIATVDGLLLAQRELVTRSLVAIANRVLPLRDRNWIWVRNENESAGYALRQTDPGDRTLRQIAGQRGLSHERLEQIEELRRRCQSLNRALQHAPGQRVRIGRSTRGDELPDPCPLLLEKIEHLREQRVDQTAHAILAAALGLRLRSPQKDPSVRRARDIHGEYERFRAPVDFIVIENLSRYLSSQDRARRENTRLMQWCHRQLVAKLRQLCETYGLPVLATPAAYSSRFCSRTGAAGFRAVELSPANRHDAPWRWTLERLAAHERGEKALKNDALAEAETVRDLFAELDRLNATRKGRSPRTLLAPIAGGPIFVPFGSAPIMQADLNAAINIALRGVAAPNSHDIHHRIRTERKKSTLHLRQSSQREKARWGSPPPPLLIPPAANTSSERTPNLFVDLAQVGFADHRVTIGSFDLPFAPGVALWTSVKRRGWQRCAQLNAARIAKWHTRENAAEDVPYV